MTFGFHPVVELSLSNHHQVVGSNGQRQAMFIENAEGLGHVILRNFQLDPERDVMLVISAGGTNAVPIEVALEAKRLGLPVIAITSVEHSRLSKPRHSSGKRLFAQTRDASTLNLTSSQTAGDGILLLTYKSASAVSREK